NLLGAGSRVNGGHQALGDAERLVQDLGDRSQTVGGAGSVGDKGHVLGVSVLVNAHDKHRGVILGRSRHDDLLCAAVDVCLCLLLGQENAGGLDNVVSANLAPRDVLGVHLSEEQDLLAVNDDGVVGVLDGAVVAAMHGVILEHVCHVVRGHERIVYRNELDVRVLQTSAENHAADAAKTVDTYFDSHCNIPPINNPSIQHCRTYYTTFVLLFAIPQM